MTKQEAVDYLEKLPIDTRIGNASIPMSSDLINMCMDALEKQVPFKLENNGYFKVCKCGREMSSTFLIVNRVYHCPNCGQWIK